MFTDLDRLLMTYVFRPLYDRIGLETPRLTAEFLFTGSAAFLIVRYLFEIGPVLDFGAVALFIIGMFMMALPPIKDHPEAAVQ